MKLAVISDIHGNWVALEAVLDALKGMGVDRILCAGDVVNFGPQPNECVQRLKTGGILTVCGNTDREALEPPALAANASRRMREIEAIAAWGRRQLTQASRHWLAGLPLVHCEGPELMVVHATPHGDSEMALQEHRLEQHFGPNILVIVAGHLHRPFIESVEGGRLWINAGSVGRPTDGDPRASFVTLERTVAGGAWTAQVHRVDYELPAAAAAIRRAGMPYANRLVETLCGACWWPD